MISQERINEIAAEAVVNAVRALADDRMGLGEILIDDVPDDDPEEQEREMDRLEAAIRLHLPPDQQ